MMDYCVLYGRCSNGRGFIAGEGDNEWGVCKDIGRDNPSYSLEEMDERRQICHDSSGEICDYLMTCNR
jgi:hypothetical protein